MEKQNKKYFDMIKPLEDAGFAVATFKKAPRILSEDKEFFIIDIHRVDGELLFKTISYLDIAGYVVVSVEEKAIRIRPRENGQEDFSI